jgi:hypothetical protein
VADINFTTALPQPARFAIGLRSPSLVYTSALTGAVQTASVPGARWMVEMEWPPMRTLNSAALEAVLMRLRGRQNRLVLWHLARAALTGVGGGTPVVNGANQTGSTINISGLPINTANWALPGDMLGIGGELKMVTAAVSSNGAGQAAVSFEPPLRVAPSNGSAIVTAAPTAKFILADDAVRWTHEPARLVTGHRVELMEAF